MSTFVSWVKTDWQANARRINSHGEKCKQKVKATFICASTELLSCYYEVFAFDYGESNCEDPLYLMQISRPRISTRDDHRHDYCFLKLMNYFLPLCSQYCLWIHGKKHVHCVKTSIWAFIFRCWFNTVIWYNHVFSALSIMISLTLCKELFLL